LKGKNPKDWKKKTPSPSWGREGKKSILGVAVEHVISNRGKKDTLARKKKPGQGQERSAKTLFSRNIKKGKIGRPTRATAFCN